jgi:GNAT superfamily N-acetyltransferase
MNEALETRPIAAADTRQLRQALLRPHQSAEELVYQGDDSPGTLHIGGFRSGRLVGIATVTKRRRPDSEEPEAWQVLGMAVDHGHRGYGLGGLMLERCLEHAAGRRARLVWCNARIRAVGFYEHYGFRSIGEPFPLPHIGIHFLMSLSLDPTT